MGQDIEKIWQQLKTERDELRLKLNLGKAELKEEWESLEEKYHEVESKLRHLKQETGESARELKKSAAVIVEEIESAYDKIKSRL